MNPISTHMEQRVIKYGCLANIENWNLKLKFVPFSFYECTQPPTQMRTLPTMFEHIHDSQYKQLSVRKLLFS